MAEVDIQYMFANHLPLFICAHLHSGRGDSATSVLQMTVQQCIDWRPKNACFKSADKEYKEPELQRRDSNKSETSRKDARVALDQSKETCFWASLKIK